MAQDTFSKGLGTLLTELRRSLTDREVFSREEIEDSAIAIDAPAALKVRMLVSPFVR